MNTASTLLTKIRVGGLRSLADVTVDLGPINVLIGPNGAGKSNLLTALRLLTLMRAQGLQRFVGEQGGATRLLHYGPQTTRSMSIALEFKDGDQSTCYEALLGYAVGDKLIFEAENVFLGALDNRDAQGLQLGTGHAESELGKTQLPDAASGAPLNSMAKLIDGIGVFHFHNTSSTAPLRQNSHAAEHKFLRPDGSNLATILYRLKQSEHPGFQAAWKRIEGLVQSIAPFIQALDPNLVALIRSARRIGYDVGAPVYYFTVWPARKGLAGGKQRARMLEEREDEALLFGAYAFQVRILRHERLHVFERIVACRFDQHAACARGLRQSQLLERIVRECRECLRRASAMVDSSACSNSPMSNVKSDTRAVASSAGKSSGI